MSNNTHLHISSISTTKDYFYYITTPIRLTSIYWYVSSHRILNLPIHNLKEIITLVMDCKNEDSFFGFNIKYPSSLLATLNALQIFYTIGHDYYDENILIGLKNFMNNDGSFINDVCGENDNRFLVSAILILHFQYLMKNPVKVSDNEASTFYSEKLNFTRCKKKVENNLYGHIDIINLGRSVPNDFIDKYLDRKTIINYIFKCENEDGGFGPIPLAESHAANTFCCISALCSLNALHLIDESSTVRFLVFRQTECGGLNGRINKKEDLCYSFWVFSCLYMLNKKDYIDNSKLYEFIERCYEKESGMYADKPDNEPDLYHSLYAYIALSLLDESRFDLVDPSFGI